MFVDDCYHHNVSAYLENAVADPGFLKGGAAHPCRGHAPPEHFEFQTF